MAHEGGLGEIAGESVSGEASDEDFFGGVGHEKQPRGTRRVDCRTAGAEPPRKRCKLAGQTIDCVLEWMTVPYFFGPCKRLIRCSLGQIFERDSDPRFIPGQVRAETLVQARATSVQIG